jgi:hypothetical protein
MDNRDYRTICAPLHAPSKSPQRVFETLNQTLREAHAAGDVLGVDLLLAAKDAALRRYHALPREVR